MKYYSSFLFILLVTQLAFQSHAETYHHPLEFMQKIKSDPSKGEKIYNNMCANCHAEKPMINVGAPKFRNATDWSPRQKKGLQTLVKNLQDNLGIMPARGGCFECSDQDLAAAIQYMLPMKEKKKTTKA